MNALRLDLHHKDYSFELTPTSLQIREKAKNRAECHKASNTALRLREHLMRITEQNKTLHTQTRADLRQFLNALREKSYNRLSEQHGYFAPIVRIFQYIFSCGALAAINDAEKALDAVPQRDLGVLPLDLVDHEKALALQLKQNHLKLYEIFGLKDCGSEQELQQAVERALLNPIAFKLLYKYRISEQSLALLLPLLEKSEAYRPVHSRYIQLLGAACETRTIPGVELISAAFYIEWMIRQDEIKDGFFHTSKTGLSHHIQIDGKTRDFYLIANPENSVIKEPSQDAKFKEVMAAAKLKADDRKHRPEIAAILITKLTELDDTSLHETVLDEKALQFDVKNTLREVDFCREFSGKWGLAEFRTAAKFVVDKKPRVAIIFTARTGNLGRRLFEDKRPISLEELIVIAKDLVTGLHYMHLAKAIHADIKLHNALFQENEKGVISRAELCDFGQTFRAGTKQLSPCFRVGHAGTVGFTPPELYGVIGFEGSFYAVDIWTLGCLFYQLLHGKRLPWEQKIKAHVAKNFVEATGQYKNKALLTRTRKSLEEDVEREVEPRFAELQAKEARSKREEFEFLTLQMMRLNPAKRIEIEPLFQKTELL